MSFLSFCGKCFVKNENEQEKEIKIKEEIKEEDIEDGEERLEMKPKVNKTMLLNKTFLKMQEMEERIKKLQKLQEATKPDVTKSTVDNSPREIKLDFQFEPIMSKKNDIGVELKNTSRINLKKNKNRSKSHTFEYAFEEKHKFNNEKSMKNKKDSGKDTRATDAQTHQMIPNYAPEKNVSLTFEHFKDNTDSYVYNNNTQTSLAIEHPINEYLSNINRYNDSYSCNQCEDIYKYSIFNKTPLVIMKCLYCNNVVNSKALDYYMKKYKADLVDYKLKEINANYNDNNIICKLDFSINTNKDKNKNDENKENINTNNINENVICQADTLNIYKRKELKKKKKTHKIRLDSNTKPIDDIKVEEQNNDKNDIIIEDIPISIPLKEEVKDENKANVIQEEAKEIPKPQEEAQEIQNKYKRIRNKSSATAEIVPPIEMDNNLDTLTNIREDLEGIRKDERKTSWAGWIGIEPTPPEKAKEKVIKPRLFKKASVSDKRLYIFDTIHKNALACTLTKTSTTSAKHSKSPTNKYTKISLIKPNEKKETQVHKLPKSENKISMKKALTTKHSLLSNKTISNLTQNKQEEKDKTTSIFKPAKGVGVPIFKKLEVHPKIQTRTSLPTNNKVSDRLVYGLKEKVNNYIIV